MTLKIEEGKFYRDGCGRTIGPMKHLAWGDYAWRGSDVEGHAYKYTASGQFFINVSDEWDLVAECIVGPEKPAAPDVKEQLAGEAVKIVTGARRGAYGAPENSFMRIARFWNAYFLNTGRSIQITAADVSPMMRLMKEARLCETPDHRDSFVDLIGYTLTGAEVNGLQPVDTVSAK